MYQYVVCFVSVGVYYLCISDVLSTGFEGKRTSQYDANTSVIHRQPTSWSGGAGSCEPRAVLCISSAMHACICVVSETPNTKKDPCISMCIKICNNAVLTKSENT